MVVLFLSAGANAAALPDSDVVKQLASSPTWLRLLKADKSNDQRSAINSPAFFVTGNPTASPVEELTALLTNIESPADAPDQQLRCRFPARSFWLSHELDRPLWRDFGHCERLQDWASLDQLDSISLIMISGYFGNPASTFGHSLLRINNSATGSDTALLDLGINFGARVPPDEWTVAYILRGLFGGYQAGFSDRTFFEHDQTYSRIEFRDRWEYTLALSERQRTFLTLHVWELAGRTFTYYFLEENCSYRLAELLELVYETPVLDDVSLWYAPVSLFHDLRAMPLESPAFSEVRYVPSVETTLRYSLAGLDPGELQAVRALIEGRPARLPDDTAERQRIFSAALDYFNYQLAGSEENELEAVRRRKNEVLLRRLALPVAPAPRVAPPDQPAPSSLAPPSALDIGIGMSDSGGAYLLLSLAAFRYDGIGNDALGRSALVVGDLSLGIDEDEGVFIDRLDVVRARKVNAPFLVLPGESRNSWEVAFGARRARQNCLDCLEAYASAALGRAARLGRVGWVDASLTGSLSSKNAALEVGPQLTLGTSSGQRWAAEIDAALLFAPDRGTTRQRYGARARYSFSARDEFSLSVVSDFGTGVRAYYSRRW